MKKKELIARAYKSYIYRRIRAHLEYLFPRMPHRRLLGIALQIYCRRIQIGLTEFRKPRLYRGEWILDKRCELDEYQVLRIRDSTILANLETLEEINAADSDRQRVAKRIK
jgi:hypothetical protein